MTQGETDTTSDAGPVGIGGWLVLPVIGVVLTLVRGLLSLLDLQGLEGMASRLTQAQLTFVIAEIIGNALVLFLLPLVLLVLLARKKRSFPRLYIVWAVAAFVFLVGDLVIANIVFREVFASGAAELLDADTVRALVSSAVLVLVWVPYMLNSRRVKNTFVN